MLLKDLLNGIQFLPAEESPDMAAVNLVKRAYAYMPPLWQAVVPAMQIVVCSKPFNRIGECDVLVQKYLVQCRSKNKMADFQTLSVLADPKPDGRSVVYVYYPHGQVMKTTEFMARFIRIVASLTCMKNTTFCSYVDQAFGKTTEGQAQFCRYLLAFMANRNFFMQRERRLFEKFRAIECFMDINSRIFV